MFFVFYTGWSFNYSNRRRKLQENIHGRNGNLKNKKTKCRKILVQTHLYVYALPNRRSKKSSFDRRKNVRLQIQRGQ